MATFGQLIVFGPILDAGDQVTRLNVYHYTAGTTTLLDVYTDRSKTTTAAQPVVSDSNGIVSFYADGIFKFVIKDGSDSTTLYTYDNWNVQDNSGALSGEGAALTAASTLTLGTDGNKFHVAGSTGITALSGTQPEVTLIFDSTPTLTHSGSLILLSGANYTAVANDVVTFMNEGSNVWREVSRGNDTIGSLPSALGSAWQVPTVNSAGTALSYTSMFTTGDVKLTIKTVADTGWVLMDDKTLGNASSGATGRANADTVDLFTLLWNNTADADCAVSTGRGASAAADYAANKTIALPKALGRSLATYGSGSGLTARAMAKIVGAETHQLTLTESAAHTHTVASKPSGVGGGTPFQNGSENPVNVTSSSAGSDGAHNNMQPTLFLNTMIKL